MRKVILYYFLGFTLIIAQNSNLKFTHITTDNGLSQSNVKTIIQDNLGFMWFGTFDGLNKYDGYSFTIYKSNQNDSTSIKTNSILTIFEDSENLLWIGTDQGICIYDRNKDKFTSFTTPKYPVGIISGEVGAFAEDKNKNIWIATSKGLVLYSRKDKTFTEYLSTKSGISDNYAKFVYKDSRGNIWIGTSSGGLNQLNSDKKTFSQYALQLSSGEIKKNYEIRAITEDKNHILWVGTYGNGLASLRLDNLSDKTLSVLSNNPSDPNSYKQQFNSFIMC